MPAESNISDMNSEEKKMESGGVHSDSTDTNGDGTIAGYDTEREDRIGIGECLETRGVDEVEEEECELIAGRELGEEGEHQEKGSQREACEFVEEITGSDNEGDCRIQIEEGAIEGENEKGSDMDEECEVEGEDAFENESDTAEESESGEANKSKQVKDESERGEESEDDEVTENTVNNVNEGGTISGMFEMQVEESDGVDDKVTDVVTPALKLLIFNILMPCLDIYFDSSLILRLYPQYWGCILVIVSGLLLHFTFTCLAWWRLEPRVQKRWSWIFLLLQIWPQIKAIQVRQQLIISELA